jgi:hypothetical protein
MFLAMQADPAIESAKGDPLRNGFEEILARISARTIAFARPVLCWVEVVVDARTPEVFRVLPHIVAANRSAR